MANFNYLDFFKIPSETDKKLFIKNINNEVVWSLTPFKILSSIIQNNNIRINFTNNDYILIDFNNVYESKIALANLQSAIDILRNKVPANIDKDVELYVKNLNGTLTLAGDLIPATDSLYNIGSESYKWKSLHVASGSVYIGGVTISSNNDSILIDKIGLGANQLQLSADSDLLYLNNIPTFAPSFTTFESSNDGAKILSSNSYRFNQNAFNITSVRSLEGFDNTHGFYLSGILPSLNNNDNIVFSVSGIENEYKINLFNDSGVPNYSLSINYDDPLYSGTYSESLHFSLYSDGELVYYYINDINLVTATYSNDTYYFYSYVATFMLGDSYTFSNVLFYPTGKRGWSDKYYCISDSFITIPPVNGVVSLQTQKNLAWSNGQYAKVANQKDTFYTIGDYFEDDSQAKKFLAQVDSYDKETGELILVNYKSDTIGATGSIWYINLSGELGSASDNSYFISASFSRISTTYSLVMSNSRLYMDGGFALRFTNYNEGAINSNRRAIRFWDKPGPINYSDEVNDTTYERAQISFNLGDTEISSISLHSFDWTDVNNQIDYEYKFYNGEFLTLVNDSATSSVINNATLKGTTNLQQTVETLNSSTASTNIEYDFNLGSIWYHDNLTSDYEADFINIPTNDNKVITSTIIIGQTGSAYLPTSLKINGSTHSIKWANGELPSGNANQTNIVGFSFILYDSGISVLGQVSTYATI